MEYLELSKHNACLFDIFNISLDKVAHTERTTLSKSMNSTNTTSDKYWNAYLQKIELIVRKYNLQFKVYLEGEKKHKKLISMLRLPWMQKTLLPKQLSHHSLQ